MVFRSLFLLILHSIRSAGGYIFTPLFSGPLGFIFGLGKWGVLFFVYSFNVLQILFFPKVLHKASAYSKFKKIFGFENINELERKHKLVRNLEKRGILGVFILSMLPMYAGGIWAALLVSETFGYKKSKSLPYIFTGSFVGCFITVFGIYGIITSVKILISDIIPYLF